MALPACVPTIFTLAFVYATEMRIVSKRPTTKQGKEQTQGVLAGSGAPAPVPLGVVLHEGDALALDRVGHDDDRADGGLGLVERLLDLVEVVAVDLDHDPAH